MPNRKRGSRRKGGGIPGGFKSFMAAGVMIVLIAASIIGWWNYNGFKSVGDALDWFQNKSANMDECVDGNLNSDNPDAQNIVNAHGCIIPNVVGGNGSGGTAKGGTIQSTPENKEATLTALDSLTVAAPENVD